MCRIFGHFDADATPHELRTAALLQRHGGPDTQVFTSGRGWALGSNRLAIMDPEGGTQPFTLGESIRVVFNGEIYNHHEIRTKLEGRGYRFTDRCDGNVLPALYAEYGAAFVDQLDGMYAIAVLDSRDEPTLLLATDHVGMKPLYYHWDTRNRRLYFGSEIPSLLSFRSVSATPWLPGLDAYLTTKTPFGARTMFEEVLALPPAATLTVSRRQGAVLRLRSTPARVDPPTTLEHAGVRLLDLLRDEVRRLSVADVPICVITSGGLDSSFVTALLAERGTAPPMFNVAYRGDWPHDERHFAREVATMWHGEYHQVEIDPNDFPAMLPDLVWHLGQPNADPITVSTYGLFAAVHEAGFRVALTGDGADEVFAGYDRVRSAVAGGPDWAAGYLDALAVVPRAVRERLYSRDYREFLDANGREYDALLDSIATSCASRLDRMTGLEVGRRMPAYHLRRVDHLSMAHAVEARLPYCQPKVVQFGRSLPERQRIDGDRVKRALYVAASDHLPSSVLRRRKQPFTLPITAMLRHGQPLMELVRDVLSPLRLHAGGLLDPGAVQAVFTEQLTQPNDRAALILWALAIHEIWLDQFTDRAVDKQTSSHRAEVAS